MATGTDRTTCIEEVKGIFALLEKGREATHEFLGAQAAARPEEAEMEAVKPALIADLFGALEDTKASARLLLQDLEALRGYF